MQYSYTSLAAGSLQLMNDGHMFGANGVFGELTLPSGRYTAQQIRILLPSEHTINGEHATGELQIVHIAQGMGVTMLAILLQTPEETPGDQDARLDPVFWKSLGFEAKDGLPKNGAVAPNRGPVDLNAFREVLSGKYYHYQGSMTNPPCLEGIHWYVFDRIAVMPSKAVPAGISNLLEIVKRPVQPLNDRKILRSQLAFAGEFADGATTITTTTTQLAIFTGATTPTGTTAGQLTTMKAAPGSTTTTAATETGTGTAAVPVTTTTPAPVARTQALPRTTAGTAATEAGTSAEAALTTTPAPPATTAAPAGLASTSAVTEGPACGSPIDIKADNIVLGDAMQPLEWRYSPLGQRTLENHVQGLRVVGSFGVLRLPDGLYDVESLRLNFPSEHRLEGKAAVGELQILHRRRGCHAGSCAAIVGALLQLPTSERPCHSDEAEFFGNLGFGSGLTLPGYSESAAIKGNVDLGVLQSQLAGEYFHYVGSKTEPPCSEPVHWYILQGPLVVPSDALESFRQLFLDAKDRLAHPLPARKVLQSRTALPGEFEATKTPQGATGPTGMPAVPTMTVEAGLKDAPAVATAVATTPEAAGPAGAPATTTARRAARPSAWSYESADQWAAAFPGCSGAAQSPIDVRTAHLRATEEPQPLTYDYYPYDLPGEQKIANDGHLLRLDADFGTLALPDGMYQVKHVLFHFPSEHSINGKLAAGELQIVHQKQGSRGAEGLAIVGLLLESEASAGKPCEGPQRDFFASLRFGSEDPLPERGEAVGSVGPVDLNVFGGQLQGDYYHYRGSLTQPACNESVSWYVLKDPAIVTDVMIASCKRLFPDPQNNRPTQPLNGREVLLSRIALASEYHNRPYVFRTATTSTSLVECPFNCHDEGPASGEKSEWCCSHEGLLCPEQTTAATSTTRTTTTALAAAALTTTRTERYDCGSGYPGRAEYWAPDQRRWCCRHAQKGCEDRDREWAWAKLHPTCEGSLQSPVGVISAQCTRGTISSPLIWDYQAMQGGTLASSGYAVQVKGAGFGSLRLPDGLYKVTHLEFHFPSEHSMDGRVAAGEMQIVHEREGRLAVVALLLWPPQAAGGMRQDVAEMDFFKNLSLSSVSELASNSIGVALTSSVDLGVFQNQLAAEYYHYVGSLTTPPCTHAVHWYVLQQPGVVPAQVADEFARLAGKNNRPVQPLHGREVIISSLSIPDEFPIAGGGAWSYGDPATWSQRYPHCAGNAQSPIRITQVAVPANAEIEGLKVSYSPVSQATVLNAGHDLRVKGAFGSLELPDGTYEAVQLRFHFPAEHEIVGRPSAGEMHIVHRKRGSGEKGLAVVGLLLATSPTIAPAGRRLDEASGEEAFFESLGLGQGAELPGRTAELRARGAIDLGAFRAQLSGPYYHYVGSMTQPPCAEGVHWYVLEGQASVSREAVEAFKEHFPDPGNSRPVQPLNGRRVLRSRSAVPGEFPAPAAPAVPGWAQALPVGWARPAPHRPRDGGGAALAPRAQAPPTTTAAPAAASAAPEPYDCNAGLKHFYLGWSVEKQAWCCSRRQRGCVPFDCKNVVLQHAWSMEHRDWCCEHAHVGCLARDTDWDYAAAATWHATYPDCGGGQQSPISLGALPADGARLGKRNYLTLRYESAANCSLANTGHKLRLEGALGRLALPDGIYDVKGVYFHFPSEHRVNGILSDGEMQIVHQKRGSSGNSDLAIIAILLKLPANAAGKPLNSLQVDFFTNLGFYAIGKLPTAGNVRLLQGKVSLEAFRVKNAEWYYHYMGSLTTPPCTEGVHWYVLAEPAVVDTQVVASFKALFPDPDNSRPLQPLNERKVEDSRLRVQGSCEFRQGCGQSGGLTGWLMGFIGHLQGKYALAGPEAKSRSPRPRLALLALAAAASSLTVAVVARARCAPVLRGTSRYEALHGSGGGRWDQRRTD